MDLLEHTDISENVRNAARVVDSKICSVEQRFMRDTTIKRQFFHTYSHWRGKKCPVEWSIVENGVRT